jgi:hypothetical protein
MPESISNGPAPEEADDLPGAMTDPQPPPCAVCGSGLLESLTPREAIAIGGNRVRFRRNTDFVLCPNCFTLYRIGDLREGRATPVTDEDLLAQNDAAQED